MLKYVVEILHGYICTGTNQIIVTSQKHQILIFLLCNRLNSGLTG